MFDLLSVSHILTLTSHIISSKLYPTISPFTDYFPVFAWNYHFTRIFLICSHHLPMMFPWCSCFSSTFSPIFPRIFPWTPSFSTGFSMVFVHLQDLSVAMESPQLHNFLESMGISTDDVWSSASAGENVKREKEHWERTTWANLVTRWCPPNYKLVYNPNSYRYNPHSSSLVIVLINQLG